MEEHAVPALRQHVLVADVDAPVEQPVGLTLFLKVLLDAGLSTGPAIGRVGVALDCGGWYQGACDEVRGGGQAGAVAVG